MLNEIKNIKSEKSDIRKFGITIGVLLLIIAGFLYWKSNGSFQIYLIVGVVLFVLGITKAIILKPVYWIWMVFATILGWIMTRVILSLLFYVVLTSIGLILRLFGKQFLDLKYDKNINTFWNYRESKQMNRENYEKQF